MTTPDEIRKRIDKLSRLLKQAEKLAGSPEGKAAAHSAQVAAKSREHYAAAAEIGAIPLPKNQRRRNAAGKSLLKFLTTYFPHSTGLKPFSDDHKRMISDLERIIP